MNLNSKENCINGISLKLAAGGRWRRGLQKRYPADAERNARAADTLMRLAAEVSAMSDEQWEQLRPFFNWASPLWNDAVSQAARNVEFKPHVRTLAGFVNNLVIILTEQRQAA